MDPCVHEPCPFEYFQLNVFFGIDITMDTAWTLYLGFRMS